ncbi:MAG: cytochrome b/b6 domain-containing protein [Coriobacteriia bacterium]|nr:cytochrome b/b6 domain-containing protein [Coriobacteriia bacterium]
MDLLQINVTLDILFVVVYIAVWLFLGWHFTWDIKTGRFHKKWVEGKWPEHDHGPPPAMPKILHATHMFSIIFLGISGMYIRFPFFSGGRVFMRYTHYFFMIVVTINLVWRVWYAFWSKNRDWREFAITKKDASTALGVLKYYGYLSNEKPHVAKYNVMQKMSYLLFLGMMVLQAYTGFALVTQKFIFGFSPRDLLVGWWLGGLLGSVDLAGWYARTLHYVLNWAFIIMTTIHVYLSATVDIPVTLNFFGLKDLEPHPHGEPLPEPAPVATAMRSPFE